MRIFVLFIVLLGSQTVLAADASEKSAGKNLLIIADMEGTMGIADKTLFDGDSEVWSSYGRRLLTEEVNMAAIGGIKAGAEKIYFCDAHNSGRNTDERFLKHFVIKLPPHSCNSNMHGLDTVKSIYQTYGIAAVAMVGYHAMVANIKGFAPHSVDGYRFKSFKINDKDVGEIALIAGVAGYFDIPVVAVSGDKEAAEEAKNFLKGVYTAGTKEKLPDGRVALQKLDDAGVAVFKAVYDGFKNRDKIVPLKLKAPFRFELEVKDQKNIAKLAIPSKIKKEGLKFSWTDQDYLFAWNTFWSFYLDMMLSDVET